MEQEIQQLKDRITQLENAQNTPSNALIFDELLSMKGDYDTTLERTVTYSAGGGSFIVPENPVNTLYLKYKGTNYRIFLYPLT